MKGDRNMKKALLLGESWTTHMIHQKGFDSFTTTEYVEGGKEYAEALRSDGWEVDHMPAHAIETAFPADLEALGAYDLVVISDVGANTFLLTRAVFNTSVSEPNRLGLLREYVLGGGGLLMVGGYLSFSGVDAKAGYAASPIGDLLPVRVLEVDDRAEHPEGAAVKVLRPDHPAIGPTGEDWPDLLGFNRTEPKAAAEVLAELEERSADDRRVVWYRGLYALATGDRETAAAAFDAVHGAFPGEPAPKLALGVCAEALGRWEEAARYYRLVWATDRSWVSAAFGLARVRLATGDRHGAVRVLESVPESSVHHTAARVAAVRARLRQRSPYEPLLEDLRAAAREVERLRETGLDALRRERLTAEVLGSALDWVLAGRLGAPAPAGSGRLPPLLDCELDETGLRLGLERSFRLLARLAQTGAERIELVERANRLRPRTWV